MSDNAKGVSTSHLIEIQTSTVLGIFGRKRRQCNRASVASYATSLVGGIGTVVGIPLAAKAGIAVGVLAGVSAPLLMGATALGITAMGVNAVRSALVDRDMRRFWKDNFLKSFDAACLSGREDLLDDVLKADDSFKKAGFKQSFIGWKQLEKGILTSAVNGRSEVLGTLLHIAEERVNQDSDNRHAFEKILRNRHLPSMLIDKAVAPMDDRKTPAQLSTLRQVLVSVYRMGDAKAMAGFLKYDHGVLDRLEKDPSSGLYQIIPAMRQFVYEKTHKPWRKPKLAKVAPHP